MARIALKVVGKTEDGRLVVSGVFRYYETIGIPLDVLFDCLRQKRFIPDWLSFYAEAIRAGMQHDRILAKLEPALSDAFGGEFRDRVIKTLEVTNKDR
jgi:hypothetical protein